MKVHATDVPPGRLWIMDPDSNDSDCPTPIAIYISLTSGVLRLNMKFTFTLLNGYPYGVALAGLYKVTGTGGITDIVERLDVGYRGTPHSNNKFTLVITILLTGNRFRATPDSTMY